MWKFYAFFNRGEIFLPDQFRQGGVCFWLATNIIVVCSLVRESFVICGMLLYTSCWSLFPAYCGYHWTGASLSIIEDIIELDISVFVQKLDSFNNIEARAKCIGLKSNQWKEVASIFSRTRSFYKCQLLNSCKSPKTPCMYVWYIWKEQRTQRLKNICWQLKVQKLKAWKVKVWRLKVWWIKVSLWKP